jgi:hypothetical protein
MPEPEAEAAVLPIVEDMPPEERVAEILRLRTLRAQGHILTDEQTVFAVRLLRAERNVAAKRKNKKAPDAGPAMIELSEY